MVRATGSVDTLGNIYGKPVFKMGSDTYENDTMAFNMKTKKGVIHNVYTQQEEGFLTSQKAKRNDEGVLFLQHGRYTTCDQPHPDFYIALSRAKVRPGKDVVFGPAHLVVCDVHNYLRRNRKKGALQQVAVRRRRSRRRAVRTEQKEHCA